FDHGLQKMMADHVLDLVAPFVHCLRHEGWLQQRADPTMLLTVHCENDQAIKERAQSFSDESAGETDPVPQDGHHVVVLEQGECRACALLHPGVRRHTKLSHEITLVYGRVVAHLPAEGVDV